MNQFQKISEDQYNEDFDLSTHNYVPYEDIKLPQRATKFSAGYDFYSTITFTLSKCQEVRIPTGVRVKLDPDKFLAIYPRSGLGFKYRLALANATGIIDSDYYNSDNEGHIWVKLYLPYDSRYTQLTIHEGDAICQGIIQQYFTTDDDNSNQARNGGFGSTDKNS